MTPTVSRHGARATTVSRGQSMVEYLVVLAVVAGVFALPVGGDQPLLLQFADAIGEGFARFLTAISLPL
ncbi:hypothetical protein [Thauera sp. WH-1]|uniref:hypothetical protein n=1 Tax=Thauera sp. WH-1 TaxID=3398230 RepID=UPI0039FD0F26